MDCRDVQTLLHPYSDGELDLVRLLQVEHHLADCAGCAERERGLRVLREAVAAGALYHRAPDALRARLRAAPASPAASPDRGWRQLPAWLAAAAAAVALLAGACLTAGVFVSRSRESAENRLVDQMVAGHVRSLQVDHATDVASSDRHTVKPWFRGKLEFSPQVPDLSSHGYVLTGGRLDYLADRAVAALVYHRRDHAINVITWPAESGDELPLRSLHRQGFHIRHWQRAGMTYWTISELNPQELDDFVRLLRETTPAPQ